MNKQELIKKIQSLEGLTNNEKADLLALLRQSKKYGLVWEEKPEDVEKRLVEELPVLSEVKEHALLNNSKAPNHILIEGDNLEALTALSYTHAGKIDVIYIDPPYNTGNKDFVYNDSYVDREDSYRHSKWLSFMNKRLKIAKQLLSDRGVIFISIDDNERANLKLLCDEVFGEKNFICDFIWEKTQHFGRQKLNFYCNADFILCYAKNKFIDEKNKKIRELLVEKTKTNLEDAPLYNASNPIKRLLFPKGVVKFNLPDGEYSHTTDEKYVLHNTVNVRNGINTNDFELSFASRWARSTVLEEIQNGTIFWVKTKKFAIRSIYNNGRESKESPKQIIFTNRNNEFVTTSANGIKVGTNEDGSSLLFEILNNDTFDYPKPMSLILYLCSLIQNPTSTILDFFAGSGTTLHATMQLNAEDGGSRQCILVTNNENGICENITYERNKRVINGYTKPNGDKVAGLSNNNLRYYRTAFVGRERTSKNMRELMRLATDMLCIKNDIYTEAQLENRKINPNIARYFEENGKQMLVIYCEEAIPQIVKHIASMPMGSQKIKVYLFSPTGYAFNDDFEEVESRVQLCALPNAIYEAYKRVLPKREHNLSEDEQENNENK